MWRPIESAPKDGTVIVVKPVPYSFEDLSGLVNVDSQEYECYWNPELDSWIDENGGYDGKVVDLKVTGGWNPVDGNGWLQPNEVESWRNK